MSQILTVELNDEVYAVIQSQAKAAGTSPAHWIATTLEQQYSRLRDWQLVRAQRTEAEKQAARERFERHFGEVDLGYAAGVDNEQIDADLAREYADTHEEH
jgi:predicted transcriptional regulator